MTAELWAMEQEESSTLEGEKRRIRLLPDGISGFLPSTVTRELYLVNFFG
jgi:hypothetical protein